MKKRLPLTHWTVRSTTLVLAIGSLIGIYLGIEAMDKLGRSGQIVSALFIFLYLGTGAAAVALWFGEERGLHWTRLLLMLQVPFVQCASFSYLFFTGAIGLIYIGSQFGLQGYIGASFRLTLQLGAPSGAGFAVGVNLLAVAMLVVLGRVDLTLAAPPPRLSQTPSAGDN